MKRKLNCILLIDDNPLTTLFSEKLITKMDISNRVLIAENGQEGMDYLNKTGKFSHHQTVIYPELILLDINMPVMDGWAFVEEFEKIPFEQKNNTNIIMLTTSPHPDDKQKAQQCHAIVDYKMKPLTKETMQEILEHHFQKYL